MADRTIRIADIWEAEQLYRTFVQTCFPEPEQKPLKVILRMLKEDRYRMLVLEENGTAIGIAFLTILPDCGCGLLDYLAVLPEYRRGGCGAMLLDAVRSSVPNLLILIETEAEDCAVNEEQLQQRKQRNQFYERHGCRRTGVRTSIFCTVYDNWILNEGACVPSEKETEGLLTEIYHVMVPEQNLYEQGIAIPFTDSILVTNANQRL